MISKLLIANRGEIARRVMRTAHAMGIECVAVYSDPDTRAPYVSEADASVRLPGSSAAETYLRGDLLIGAARTSGADAIHPGYGFLSESAAFARACIDSGITFVGPPPEAMEAMASKTRAKELMSAAGVPVLPSVKVPQATISAGAGASSNTQPTQHTSGHGPDETSREKLLEKADEIGWPILVKATYGGGGRGMRLVESRAGLLEALASAAREASSAFGDPSVFLERCLQPAHHVEVQVFADKHGNVVHLFERECSIQRRHQKIIEEAPSPTVDEELRNRMGDIAVAATRAIGYLGAGTVEMLLSEQGDLFFLEMNTRLQVEHPVTELVCGLDLVRLQLLVADGQPLPQEALNARMSGHAIEARLYAEDPRSGWSASSGTLQRFRFKAPGTSNPPTALPQQGTTLRVDSGVEDGAEVSAWYDPMLAKIIVHASTRTEAARALALSLRQAEIHGLTTNRSLLAAILTHPEFLAGRTDTGFLERHDPAMLAAGETSEETERLHALAGALASQAARRQRAPVLASIPSGWRNNPSQLQKTSLRTTSAATSAPTGAGASDGASNTRGDIFDVEYRFARGSDVICEVNGASLPGVRVAAVSPDQVELEVKGVFMRFGVHLAPPDVFVDSPLGSSAFTELERFPRADIVLAPGALTSPMPASVTKVLVAVGDIVEQGQALMTIEAMKVEHGITAPKSGTVAHVRAHEGQQVGAGETLIVLDEGPEDSDQAEPARGTEHGIRDMRKARH